MTYEYVPGTDHCIPGRIRSYKDMYRKIGKTLYVKVKAGSSSSLEELLKASATLQLQALLTSAGKDATLGGVIKKLGYSDKEFTYVKATDTQIKDYEKRKAKFDTYCAKVKADHNRRATQKKVDAANDARKHLIKIGYFSGGDPPPFDVAYFEKQSLARKPRVINANGPEEDEGHD